MSEGYANIFNKDSYNENDLIGKQLLIAFLYKKGYEILPKTFDEDFGVDIHAKFEGKEYHFEVEMKDKYNFTDEDTFPFDTISFLGRKEKWKDKNFFYCIISKPTKAAIFSHSSLIYRKKYKVNLTINTDRRKGKDTFYRIPKKDCSFRTPEEFYQPDYLEIWEELLKKNKK